MMLLRYSNTGFAPLFQSKMKGHIDYLDNFNPDDLPSNLTDYARTLIIRTISENKPKINRNFELYGVHVFFADQVHPDDIRFFLNHLKVIPEAHYLEVPDDILGYTLYEPYLQEGPISLSMMTHRDGAYIPASQLIKDIHY